MMRTSNHSSWKKEYLRILNSDELMEKDWKLASELISDGYADGKVLRDSDSKTDEIHDLLWKGANTNGRLFADQLAERIRKSSLIYRVKAFMIGVAIWISGYLMKCDYLDLLFGIFK